VEGLCRDQDDLRAAFSRQATGDVEAALAAEVDVDEDDVGPERRGGGEGLVGGRGHADHGHPVVFQQLPRRVEELGAVVDDDERARRG